jgi:hypothetical protein
LHLGNKHMLAKRDRLAGTADDLPRWCPTSSKSNG